MYKDKPTCHDKDWQAQRFAPTTWRPSGEKLHPSNDVPQVFRTCSYCGSMHPEDLLAALKAGAKMSGSDWKYGWPHKFYVDQIPNANQGQLSFYSSGSCLLKDRESVEQQFAGMDVQFEEDGNHLQYRVRKPEGSTTHGKWYNMHFFDLDGPEFEELAMLVEQHTGIKFSQEVVDGVPQIKYSAPERGYQR